MALAELKLYKVSTEYGTIGNPIVFSGAVAGVITNYSLNPLYLWNDKGGGLGSVPAKTIVIQVLDMWIQNEALGTSSGAPNQTFNTDVTPIVDTGLAEEILVMVAGVVWDRVGSFTGEAPSAEVYTIDSTGLVTFGNSVNGKIPPISSAITITYMPDLVAYGKYLTSADWLEVKSLGCTTNPVTVIDEQKSSFDTTHVYASNIQLLTVSGVWLQSDPTHIGTNYYTGGSFIPLTGEIVLGTPLAGAVTPVLISYTHTMIDDAESDYTPIGDATSHTFTNPICQNNAKLLYFRLNIPAATLPTGGSNINFRVRLSYKQ